MWHKSLYVPSSVIVSRIQTNHGCGPFWHQEIRKLTQLSIIDDPQVTYIIMNQYLSHGICQDIIMKKVEVIVVHIDLIEKLVKDNAKYHSMVN